MVKFPPKGNPTPCQCRAHIPLQELGYVIEWQDCTIPSLNKLSLNLLPKQKKSLRMKLRLVEVIECEDDPLGNGSFV